MKADHHGARRAEPESWPLAQAAIFGVAFLMALWFGSSAASADAATETEVEAESGTDVDAGSVTETGVESQGMEATDTAAPGPVVATVETLSPSVAPVVQPAAATVDELVAPVDDLVLAPVVEVVAPVVLPVVQPVATAVDGVLAPVVGPVTDTVVVPVVDEVVEPLVAPVRQTATALVAPVADSVLDPVSGPPAPPPEAVDVLDPPTAFADGSSHPPTGRAVSLGRVVPVAARRSIPAAAATVPPPSAGGLATSGPSKAPFKGAASSGWSPWAPGSAGSARTGGGDAPDRTPRAVASATGVAHATTWSLSEPFWPAVVGPSENSGSRPAFTPD